MTAKILDTYIFSGFGFDVRLTNVVIKSVHGEEYPDIDMNALKLNTAKALLLSKQRLTGYQVKFLRTFIQMSYDDVSNKIQVAASTLRSWEGRGNEFTGLTVEHERAFRIMSINTILEREKSKYDIELSLTKEFSASPSREALLI